MTTVSDRRAALHRLIDDMTDTECAEFESRYKRNADPVDNAEHAAPEVPPRGDMRLAFKIVGDLVNALVIPPSIALADDGQEFLLIVRDVARSIREGMRYADPGELETLIDAANDAA